MATISTTIKLVSTTVSSDESLNLTVTDSLTVTEPSANLTTLSVATGSPTNILTTSSGSPTYVYVKNLDATNFVLLYTDAAVAWGKLSAGESAFFCVYDSQGLEVKANTAACLIEYGYWTKG